MFTSPLVGGILTPESSDQFGPLPNMITPISLPHFSNTTRYNSNSSSSNGNFKTNGSSVPQLVDCMKLRKLSEDCIDKHMYSSATFFADKLVTITKNDTESILLLVKCYYLSKQHRRAVHLLRLHDLLHAENYPNPQFQYMGALCLMECKEWEECLAVLGPDDSSEEHLILPDHSDEEENSHSSNNGSTKLKLSAAICLLKGKVYEALENRSKAKRWYMSALRCDVNCFEALESLIEKRMLNYNDEREFLDSLDFPENLQWLKLIYVSKLQYTPASVDVAYALSASGLGTNLDLLAGVAEHHYYRNDFREAYRLSKNIINQDPFHHSVLPIYLCCLVELEMKSELFLTAHQLVEAYPTKTIAWFSVACYYYLIGKYDLARRYFSKCTNIDPQFAPAWFGFGNTFAAQEEGDQAMAAYRTAARLFEGSHMPSLYIGMEYLRTNNLSLAHQFLQQTHAVCPSDPLICNELGVIAFRKQKYQNAIEFFRQALDLSSKEALESWEPTLFNLGHAYRKLYKFDQAIKYYETALSVTSKKASVNSALGLTYHMNNQIDKAIQFYHKALAIDPRDALTSDMLNKALQEASQRQFDLP